MTLLSLGLARAAGETTAKRYVFAYGTYRRLRDEFAESRRILDENGISHRVKLTDHMILFPSGTWIKFVDMSIPERIQGSEFHKAIERDYLSSRMMAILWSRVRL